MLYFLSDIIIFVIITIFMYMVSLNETLQARVMDTFWGINSMICGDRFAIWFENKIFFGARMLSRNTLFTFSLKFLKKGKDYMTVLNRDSKGRFVQKKASTRHSVRDSKGRFAPKTTTVASQATTTKKTAKVSR